MAATSTNPADAVVSVTSQVVTGNTVTTEQGSGVLIAPDEVLTAAHLVYDGAGQFYASTVVTAGSAGGTVYGTSGAQAIHAMPDQDWTQLTNAADDFAIIHLATPITGVPVMALGSGFAGGVVTVTGYPAATAGRQDSANETVSPVSGTAGVLQGTALGAPGDAHGASGGAVWTENGGAAAVVGLTQSEAGSTGYFLQLTSADVAQIQSWVAQDHAQDAATASATSAATPAATATSSTSAAAATAAASASSAAMAASAGTGPAGSTAADAVAFLSGDAANIGLISSHGYIDHATSRVVALLQRDAAALGAGAGFDDVASDALMQVGSNGQGRNLAAALLEGLLWGHDGGAAPAVVAGVSAQDPNIVSYHASVQSAHAGAQLGHALLAHGY